MSYPHTTATHDNICSYDVHDADAQRAENGLAVYSGGYDSFRSHT